MELPVIHKEVGFSSEQTNTDIDAPKRSRLCDCVGVVCSCACAVHCAAMPFVIGWLPALGLSWLADEAFHQWMVGACFLLAVAAVLPGYRRHRRNIVPLLAIGGVSVLATGAFALPDECCQQCVSPESEIAADAHTGDAVTNGKSHAPSGHHACCEETEQGTQCKYDVANHDDVDRDHSQKSYGHTDTASLIAITTVDPAEAASGGSDSKEQAAHDACCTKHEGCMAESAKNGKQNPSSVDSVKSNSGTTGGTEPDSDVVTAGVFSAGTIDSNGVTGNAWLNWLSRLLTPIGGVLLVSAHLMNRRCCTCCESPA
ncbi:MAG: MerC domain-containing protein [Planctomycetaceae bacterium]|jgi:hypothetical protein|nr:MerC domain-containing protein [Planctomycetaceae bacterium]